MSRKLNFVALICCLSVIFFSFVLIYADPSIVSLEGSIGSCDVYAQNQISEDRKHADATTTVVLHEVGTASTSVTATFFYLGVSGDVLGTIGEYSGFGYGSNGCSYSKYTPNDNYRFYRAESSHQASYQQGTFSVSNLINIP